VYKVPQSLHCCVHICINYVTSTHTLVE